MERINDLLEINNLKIYQNDDWFKFSLESVLLPNFITLNLRCKNIIDLCTGNAPIPLILSTKTKANIVGVEIQKDVYDLATKSVEINKLGDRIKLINDNLSNLKKYYECDYFDIVTVNPPYFPNIPLSKKNEDIHKTIARHEIHTNLENIIKTSVYLLKNGGYLAMVHQTNRFIDVINLLKKYNISINKIQLIYPKEDSKSNLFMIEGIKNGKYTIETAKEIRKLQLANFSNKGISDKLGISSTIIGSILKFIPVNDYELGDINMDGQVTEADYTLLQNYLKQLRHLHHDHYDDVLLQKIPMLLHHGLLKILLLLRHYNYLNLNKH